MPKLDFKRLTKDVDTLRKSRPADLGPGGRRLTGAMAIVRDNLAALEALHAGGTSWVDIAAGLAAQGLTQGQGDPLTSKRLTALIASVKRQADRRAAVEGRRGARPDLQRGSAAPPVRRSDADTPPPTASKPRLAPELQARPTPPSADEAPLSEAEIRQIQAERHSHLFKKD